MTTPLIDIPSLMNDNSEKNSSLMNESSEKNSSLMNDNPYSSYLFTFLTNHEKQVLILGVNFPLKAFSWKRCQSFQHFYQNLGNFATHTIFKIQEH